MDTIPCLHIKEKDGRESLTPLKSDNVIEEAMGILAKLNKSYLKTLQYAKVVDVDLFYGFYCDNGGWERDEEQDKHEGFFEDLIPKVI